MAKITINDFAKKAYKKYIDAGMTPAGACGLMGNQYAESAGFIAKTVEFLCIKRLKENGKIYTQDTYYKAVDSGEISKAEFLNPLPNKRYGFGLVQWTTVDRKRGLYERTVEKGKSIADEDIQLDYVLYELNNVFPKTFNVLKTAKTVKEASDYVLIHYEAPADTGTTMKNTRADYGQQYYDYFVTNKNNEKDVDSNMTVNEYIQKVINIAESEIGYLEKKSNKNLDDKTKNAGSNNYTKYGRDMHDIYPAVMDFPAAWCDAFVDWCFYKAYGVSTAKSLIYGNFDDYTVTSAQLYKNKGAWHKTPKKGDQVFFTNASGGICHTGLVIEVTNTQVITIEGNTSSASGVVANGGCVRKKTYSLTYARIAGYGRPAYEKFCANGIVNQNTSSSTSSTSTSKKLNTTKKWKGKTTSELNVRTWAGVEYSTCSFSPLKKGAKIDVLDEVKANDGSTWYYIKKSGKTGFVSGKYVKKISENSTENSDKSFKPYECKTTASSLNIRSGAGTSYKILGSFPKNTRCVIEQEKDGFGKLQSRDGWISLKYIKKV